jgi:SMP-30/Gluconolactonase/LRE-like region
MSTGAHVTTELPAIEWFGTGLNRPECVLTHRSGWVFAASWTGAGGISAIAPDGRVFDHLARTKGLDVRPNGIALEPDGSFLIAHLGAEHGGVFRLLPDGGLEPVLTEVSGRPIPPSNFPVVDSLGRLWLSVSTRLVPRSRDYNPGACTGMLIVMDRHGARVVADDLGYANEFLVSADGGTLYLNETFRRRLVSYAIGADGTLSGPEVIATFGPGDFPDGLAMDVEGGFWITSIVTNRLIRITPDGRREVFCEDCETEHADMVEQAFQAGTMGRPHLDRISSRVLRNTSSLAFGGPDMRTGYLGCLLGDSIATLRLPVAGQVLPHHSHDIDILIRSLAA